MDVENMDIDDTAEFGTRLWSTVAEAREKGTNAVWLKVPMLYSHFIPVAGLYGFKYHHAEGEVATLLLWLPPNVECKVPPFATHHVGVGGMVVVPSSSGDAGDSKILVVKETNKIGGLKLPGGYVNLGEDLGVAAAREVWEETGVRSVFHEVLTVRHSHNIQFGRSDVYVICRMALADSMEIKIDRHEIEEAQWITLRDYRAHTAHPMLQTVADMLLTGRNGLTEKVKPNTLSSPRNLQNT
jgi:8-oxo-dGTP pyrophosphatase MutT (NUDIX family)